jgi:hypothetical protein
MLKRVNTTQAYIVQVDPIGTVSGEYRGARPSGLVMDPEDEGTVVDVLVQGETCYVDVALYRRIGNRPIGELVKQPQKG